MTIIHIETATAKVKRKILNFQIAGDEIHVNYKIGTKYTAVMAGPKVEEKTTAVVQSDIVRLKTSLKVSVIKDGQEIYSYEKKQKEK